MLSNDNHNQGYIAVISAVIISSIVIVIALVFSSSNFLGRFDSQNVEMKEVGEGVAKGCLEYARLKLAQGAYSGNELKSIGDYTCRILPIETASGEYIIKATSTVSNKETKLKLRISSVDFQTISLEEVNSF
jgi:hypothetical protein